MREVRILYHCNLMHHLIIYLKLIWKERVGAIYCILFPNIIDLIKRDTSLQAETAFKIYNKMARLLIGSHFIVATGELNIS